MDAEMSVTRDEVISGIRTVCDASTCSVSKVTVISLPENAL